MKKNARTRIAVLLSLTAFALGVVPQRAAAQGLSPDGPDKPIAPAAPKVTPTTGNRASEQATVSNRHRTRHNALTTFASELHGICSLPAGSRITALATDPKDSQDAQAAQQALDSIATPKPAKASAAQRVRAVVDKACADLCSTAGNNAILDMCAFQDGVLANAAVAADWESVRLVIEQTGKDLTTALTEVFVDGPRAFGAVAEEERPVRLSPLVRLFRGSAKVDLQAAGGAEAAAFTTQVIGTALQALAKLIEDRAKREAIGYFLDEMGAEICTDVDATRSDAATINRARREIRTHWFPSLCAYAVGQRLSSFGVGAAMLEAVRSALASDIAGWPGAAAGLLAGAAFYKDAAGDAKADLLECNEPAKENDDNCKATRELRAATARRVSAMLEGASAATALYDLANDVDVLNAMPAPAKGPVPKQRSKGAQIAACAVSVPHTFEIYGTSMEGTSARSPSEVATAGVLATLVSAPACWTLLDQPGIDKDTCKIFAPKAAGSCTPTKGKGKNIERLSTIIALGGKVRGATASLGAAWGTFREDLKGLGAAFESLSTTQSKIADIKPPTIELGKDATSNPDAVRSALEAYVKTNARLLDATGNRRIVAAALALMRDTTGIARSVATILGSPEMQKMLGGLGDRTANLHRTVEAIVADARKQLDELEKAVAIGRALVDENWTSVLTNGASLLNLRLDCSAGKACARLRSTTARYAGVLGAMLEARTSDEVAGMLDEAARPPGGWRDKGQPGRGTLSLTAHPGIFGALEVRYGTYGVVRERGQPVYGQAPTIAMPVGLEIALGAKCAFDPISFFFPLLDPAAFLQYDLSRDGHLPAASLLTALSPGFGIRAGFNGTPFGIMPLFVYRPGFRAWEANVAGPGADAFQLGLNLSVDVTLLDLAKWGRSE